MSIDGVRVGARRIFGVIQIITNQGLQSVNNTGDVVGVGVDSIPELVQMTVKVLPDQITLMTDSHDFLKMEMKIIKG